MVFGKKNYLFMIIGIALIAISLVLLAGGGSKDPAVFSEEIFNTRRLVVAPLLMLAGFVIEIFAIMYREKKTAQ
ncbi:MAG: DUF3098 domain-containing protein [Bacteroidales bacterium]|nr:DUF3098 domain-containing protein [Bacteroidales bacterium]